MKQRIKVWAVVQIAVLLGFSSVAIADTVPPHLEAMAKQLLTSTKSQLDSSQGSNPRQAKILSATQKALRRASIPYWRNNSDLPKSLIASYANALGVQPGTAKTNSAIMKLHNGWVADGDAKALERFYAAVDDDRQKGVPQEALIQKVKETRKALFGGLATDHTVELDDNQRVDFHWNPESGEFSITTSKSGEDTNKRFESILSGTVSGVTGKDGKGLVYRVTPDAKPLKVNDAETLKARTLSILGEWTDGENIWFVRGSEGQVTDITVARQRGSAAGDEATYRNAVFVRGVLRASRVHDDARDMKPSLPTQIKAKLVGDPRAVQRIELKFDQEKSELRGKLWDMQVTYYPSENYAISKVHSPYGEPLVLVPGNKEKEYRIGKIQMDSTPFRIRRSSLEEALKKSRTKLQQINQDVTEYGKAYDQAKQQQKTLRGKYKKLMQRRAKLQAEKDQLLLPKEYPEGKRQRYVELKEKIREADLKLEALGSLSDQEVQQRQFDQMELAAREKRINLLRPRSLQTRAAFIDRLRVLDRAILDTFEDKVPLVLDFGRARREQKKSSEQGKKSVEAAELLEKEIDEFEDKLIALGKESRKGNLKTDFVTEIDVTEESGGDVFYANFEPFPFEKMISLIDKEIEETEEDLDRAKLLLNKATRKFQHENQRAIELGAEVAATIMAAARKRWTVELVDISIDVLKDFAEGGPVNAIGGAVYKVMIEVPALNLIDGKNPWARPELGLVDENKVQKIVSRDMKKYLSTVLNPDVHKGAATKAALGAGLQDPVKNLVLRQGLSAWAQNLTLDKAEKDLEKFLESRFKKARFRRYLLKRRTDYILQLNENLDSYMKPNALQHLFKPSAVARTIAKTDWRKIAPIPEVDEAEMADRFSAKRSRAGFGKKAKKLGKKIGKKLGKTLASGVKEYASEAVVDMALDAVKNYIAVGETQAWLNYYVQDMRARATFASWKITSESYFDLLDGYNAALKMRQKFLKGLDPETNYRVTTDNSFKSDAHLVIKLYSSEGNGKSIKTLSTDQVNVLIAGILAQKKAKQYSLNAKSIKALNNARLPLQLKIQ